MKKLFQILFLGSFLLVGVQFAQSDENENQAVAGITKALDLYVDAAVKGDSKVAQPAFAPGATMSYAEKGKLITVPISELYAYFDKAGPHQASYRIEAMKVAGDVAIVSIDSKFGDTAFDDMFTLVKDGDRWKIVSKVYHIK